MKRFAKGGALTAALTMLFCAYFALAQSEEARLDVVSIRTLSPKEISEVSEDCYGCVNTAVRLRLTAPATHDIYFYEPGLPGATPFTNSYSNGTLPPCPGCFPQWDFVAYISKLKNNWFHLHKRKTFEWTEYIRVASETKTFAFSCYVRNAKAGDITELRSRSVDVQTIKPSH